MGAVSEPRGGTRSPQEPGGGRGRQAVVLGPDGVRHLVTVDGATGTVTGDAVLGG